MVALRDAAGSDDAALDWALLKVGILAPADLAAIRVELTRPGAMLRATANRDGHRIVEVILDSRTVARIHHDGTVSAPTMV
jgi:hypothetical protein